MMCLPAGNVRLYTPSAKAPLQLCQRCAYLVEQQSVCVLIGFGTKNAVVAVSSQRVAQLLGHFHAVKDNVVGQLTLVKDVALAVGYQQALLQAITGNENERYACKIAGM